MKDKTTPLEKQYPMIDTIFWNLLDSEEYAQIPEVTGVNETVKEDEESLINTVKENGITGEAFKRIDLDLSAIRTGAALYGEEKGFILGFIHGVKMAMDIMESNQVFHLDLS